MGHSLMETEIEVMFNLALELTTELEWMKNHWDEWFYRELGKEQEILEAYKEKLRICQDRCNIVSDSLVKFSKVVNVQPYNGRLVKR